ncbi:MAG: hypothetical protein AMXMBFR13_15420 [Phycisphaerae bacterium]
MQRLTSRPATCRPRAVFCAACALLIVGHATGGRLQGATTQKRYYAHEAVADRHGVIAPWYKGQNGQLDWRVRIAAETLKRYPWVQPPAAATPAPAYVYSGAWKIAPDGTITIPPFPDWANGDWGQRAAYILTSMVDYYRYSGDPAAIAHIRYLADTMLEHCQTPDEHPWPGFLISVPIKGKPYFDCHPSGMIQLDIVAEVGIPLIRAAQLTGEERYLEAAKHWGDLLAAKCDRTPSQPPWNRYANPEAAPWSDDHQTGGIVFILAFLDELVRAGYTGQWRAILEARDVGRAYLRDVLLPQWTVNDTWGRNYWDWNDPVQAENVTEFAARYFMENPDYFTSWKSDARNVLTLFLNRTSVDPKSAGDVYHGAWAYPESSGCCGRSLWYGPMELVNTYAQYAVLTGSAWAREQARRQMILATYDAHETGVVEDNIDGGPIVAGDWFKIAHPMALKHCLAAIAWMPEEFGAARENHIVRSTSVVTFVRYGQRSVTYRTFDAPPLSIDVLRLNAVPTAIHVSGKQKTRRQLEPRDDIGGDGFIVKPLPNGDCIVTIRHDFAEEVTVEGDFPLEWSGETLRLPEMQALGEESPPTIAPLPSGEAGERTFTFTGNQVRLIGRVDPRGGQADVYLDGVRQLVGVDCWNPAAREGEVLYYRSGLDNGEHTLKIVPTGRKNPYAQSSNVYVAGIQFSSATGENGFGEGDGPADVQRMIFGYAGRPDVYDSHGNAWVPGTEFTVRLKHMADSVAQTWWTQRQRLAIAGTEDPELYRYGVHAGQFNVHVTVGPGQYYARLMFAETRNIDPKLRTVTVHVNGREAIRHMDIAATAAKAHQLTVPEPGGHALGMYTAVDVVLADIEPQNGIIDLRFQGPEGGEAILQALEVGPGDGGAGAVPVSVPTTQPAPAP